MIGKKLTPVKTEGNFDLSALGVFDNDGLINDIEALRNSLWPVAAREFGFKGFQPEAFRGTLGQRSDGVVQVVKEVLMPDLPHPEALQIVAQIKARRDELVSQFIEEHGVPARVGAFDLLEVFEELKLPKCIGTSSSAPSANKFIDGLHIRDRFVAVVTGDEVKNGKPAPDIFILAHERANERLNSDIPKSRSLVFEDSNNGAESGLVGGFPVVMIPGLERPKKLIRESVEAVCDSFEQAVDFVRNFVKK